jgi:drug/metabolite transporter (DMT)-like permease
MADREKQSTSNDGSSEETEKERTTRRWNEMLQELRVAQTGVQVLTGFLLTVAFSQRFSALDPTTKTAYLVTVCASVLAAGLLIAPVAFHRVLFGKSEKEWLVEAANISARAGLAMLAVTMTGVMFVIFDLVVGRTGAGVSSMVTAGILLVLWLVVPMVGAEVTDE